MANVMRGVERRRGGGGLGSMASVLLYLELSANISLVSFTHSSFSISSRLHPLLDGLITAVVHDVTKCEDRLSLLPFIEIL
jgi:hypothetical protein